MKKLLPLLGLFILSACSKGDVLTEPVAEDRVKSIYYCGYDKKDGVVRPCYWESGLEFLDLPEGMVGGKATSIAVSSSGTIYICGYAETLEGENVPCFWNNGKFAQLDYSNGDSAVCGSIAFQDGNVLISGTIYYGGIPTAAGYWKNGVFNSVATGSIVNDIAVEDGSIYLAGAYFDASLTEHPCYWKDGVRETFDFPTKLEGASLTSIDPNDGDIYASGFCLNEEGNPCPFAWKNGSYTQLSENVGITSSISARNGKYAVSGTLLDGEYDLYKPYLWVDGDQMETGLGEFGFGTINSVVYANQIYSCGSVISISSDLEMQMEPCYWEGTKQKLLQSDGNAEALDVFVVFYSE